MASKYAGHWTLRDDVDFLNHGSFGACPRDVLEAQSAIRSQIEREPVDFFTRDYLPQLNDARAALAEFFDAAPADLAFMGNATSGVNTVLRSLPLSMGDEVLVTDHTYNACRNALEFVALQSGVIISVIHLPFPADDPQATSMAVLDAVTRRTRLVLLDHVTSVSGMVLPLETLVPALRGQDVMVLVDGAHAPGMLPLSLDGLGADFYSGNCHKWMCAPKGSGFLHVRPEHQESLAPMTISHGWNTHTAGNSRFHDLFDWTGTSDPSPLLSIPTAIKVMGQMLPTGWDGVRAHNNALALRGREILNDALGSAPYCPPEMLGSLATVRLPGTPDDPEAAAASIHSRLREQGIEVPVMVAPDGSVVARISAQLYNYEAQYERLSRAIVSLLDS
jgi:isopenicillin-N epimerase